MPESPCRIWYQSFVDPAEQRPYISRLQACLNDRSAPGFQFEVHGLTPPDRHLSLLSEFRCAGSSVRNCVLAQEKGYDAFVLGHFQEPGLAECRTAVEIPVVGLGEATMLHACTLGRTFGLVTINPVFVPFHEEQVRKARLQERCAGVRAIDGQVATFMRAFEDEAAYRQVKEDFCRQVQPLLDAGAEVLIPSGGMPMLLFGREQGFVIDGAVVLDGIAVVVALAEAAVKLRRQTGVAVSRRGAYQKAPPEAVQEFLASVPPRR
jgi:Asp/Glu/hydantoin racemase